MSSDAHQRYIERQALKAAQKAMRRSDRTNLSTESLTKLRIQTVEPWKRILLALFSLLFVYAGALILSEDHPWIALLLFGLGAGLGLIALFGRRRTVGSAIDAIDLVAILEALF